jgi:hypothetical protein
VTLIRAGLEISDNGSIAVLDKAVAKFEQFDRTTREVNKNLQFTARDMAAWANSASTGAKQTDQFDASLKRISQDIRLAKADFQAGLLGIKEYQQALSFARQEAIALRGGLSPTGEQAAKFGEIMATTGARVQDLPGGLNKMERALGALAGQAVGVQGPIGNLATTLLQFGTGGLVTTGIVAGVAVIGLAWNALSREQKEAEKSLDEYIRTSERFAKGASQSVLLGNAQSNTQAQVDRIRKRLAETVTIGGSRAGGPVTRLALTGDDRTAAEDQLRVAQNKLDDIALAKKQMNEENSIEAQFWKDVLPDIRESNELWNEMAANAVKFASSLDSGGKFFDQRIAKANEIPFLQPDVVAGIANSAVADLGKVTLPDFKFPKIGHGISSQNAGLAGISALQGLLNGGGIGAVASGGLSLAGSAFGPLGSAAGGLIGSAIGKLFGGGPSADEKAKLAALAQLEEQKRTNALLEKNLHATEEMAKKAVARGEGKVSVNFISSSTGEIIKQTEVDVRRRSRLDGVNRLPKGYV